MYTGLGPAQPWITWQLLTSAGLYGSTCVCLLQGIALSADPNYKVLGSAYPWIARRLLSDSSQDLQDTLRALLYKGSKFQFARLESLLRQAVKSPPRTSLDSGRPNKRVSPGTPCAHCP